MIPEAVRPFSTQAVLGALDLWTARSTAPELFPIWVIRRDGNWHLDPELVKAVQDRGIQPVLFVESTGASYVDILRGEHDTELHYLGCRIGKIGGLITRWDQEPNGTGLGAAWQTPESKALYVQVFRHVSQILRADSDARLFYCPVGRQKNGVDEYRTYYPGDGCQIVGFTMFSRTNEARRPQDQVRASVEEFQRLAPGKPIIWGEAGRAADTDNRSRWLRDMNNVTGLYASLIFDLLVQDNQDDWRWNLAMYRTFASLS
jgi:hypothetical protein